MKKMTMLITGLKTAAEFPSIAKLGVFLLLLAGTVPALAAAPVYNGGLQEQRLYPSQGFTYTFDEACFSDPDGDSLTFDAVQADGSPLPDWFIFYSESWTFEGTAPSRFLDFTVKVIAQDGNGGSAAGTFLVACRQKPFYNGGLEDQRVRPGDPFSYSFPDNLWTEPDGDTITYEAQLATGDPLPDWFHFDSMNREFFGTAPEETGYFIVEVIGSDPEGSDSGYFRMTVAENSAPSYSGGLPDMYYKRDTTFSTDPFSETIFSDLDNDPLTYTATLDDDSPLPYWLIFDGPNRYFYGATDNVLTDYVVKVIATDPHGASAFGTFTFHVVETFPNRDPVYHDTLEPLTYLTNTTYSYSLPVNTFTDADGDVLTYSGKLANEFPLPGWINVDLVTGTIYGTTPDYEDGAQIKIIADDGNGGSAFGVTTISVVRPNSDPVYNDTLEPLVYEMGQDYSYAPPTGTFTDADGDTLTYSGTLANDDPLPDWIHVDSTTGTISGTAPDHEDGADIKITADDGNGGLACGTTSITIGSVANQPPQIDTIITDPTDPVGVSTLVCAGAYFTDPDAGDTHTAGWDWGDGATSDGIVDETEQSVIGCHTYSAAGVYTVGLTVTDAAGESDTALYKYVVVYDPSAGFVTGGGWIDSPAGAYVYDTSLSGKATFGFVSKYKKGATVPTGNTEFQFQAGDLNFHSTGYDWLVVNQADSNAQFKGSGTINGSGEYKFMLWAGDNASDTFRIRIWSEDEDGNEIVVYDNGTDQPISGGNIVVHVN